MVIKMKEELKELIINNQNLIYSIASKFKGDKEDLFQAGCLGLIDAYQKYNSNPFKSIQIHFICYKTIYKYCRTSDFGIIKIKDYFIFFNY